MLGFDFSKPNTFLVMVMNSGKFHLFTWFLVAFGGGFLAGCGKKEEAVSKADYRVYHEYWYDKTLYETGEAAAHVESTEFDFDILPPRVESAHRFKIENRGNNPLKLIAGGKSCKCTAIKIIDREIAPGETGEIEISWETVGLAKEFLHSGSVYTNDPNNRQIKFTIKGKVSREMAMKPGLFNFDRIQPDSLESRSRVLLFSEEWDFIKIRDLSTTFGEDARVEVVPMTEEQIREHRQEFKDFRSGVNLDLILKTPQKPGLVNGVVSFKMVGPDSEADHKIDVRGKIIRRLSLEETRAGVISPDSVLRLGRVDSVKGHREKFLLQVNDRKKKLAVTRVTAKPEFVGVELRPATSQVEKNGLYILEVVIPKDQQEVNHNRADHYGQLKIEFDHERVSPFDLWLDFYIIK